VVVPRSHRRLAAIMFTDMVGYSALAQVDEAAALSRLERHNSLLRPVFRKYDGREVKTVGDAFLVEFDSALDATRCALEVQQTLRSYNASAPGIPAIRIRIGIHIGDVEQTEDDVLGDAVNIASRIEPLADPEGICVSQQVYDQVQNKISLPFERLPSVRLKNIRVPMTVYRLVQPWEARGETRALPAVPMGRGLAVLPLTNISPDPSDSYFADGLTEELISSLSQVRDLSVIARSSVAPYKTSPKPIADVGAELGVDTVLEGSVRKAGNRLRITLQLVDVATQRHIWASSYNRELDDVFAVQSDIAERTADALRLEFSRAEPPGSVRKPTANLDAYDLYLRGLVAAGTEGGKGIDEAIRCFRAATELDPTFAEAFGAWANLYVVAAGDYLPMREVIPRARELARRALELDPDSSEAHAARGNIVFQFDNDWRLAEAEFRRAIELNPNNVTAHRFLGLLLIALNRFDEAKEVLWRAIRLDPGAHDRNTVALAELYSGNYDAALSYALEERDQDPASIPNHIMVGMFALAAGRRDLALKEADTPVPPDDDVARFDLALLSALVGRPEAAREVAAEVERGEAKSYTSATHLAMLYGALGEKERALDLLEKDYREGDRILWLFYRGAYFSSLRKEPRFIALVQSFGLPTEPVPGPTAPAP
jgi:adenylate cyclase